MVVGVIPSKNDVGVQYIGGGLIFDVGVHTPVRTIPSQRNLKKIIFHVKTMV